jgi:hypothetical protein
VRNEESAISEEAESPSTARDDIDLHLGRKITSGSATFRKEVLMPAWQFFHLIRMFSSNLVLDSI